MNKKNFIKLIDGDKSYLEDLKDSVRYNVIELNEKAREEIKITDTNIIDTVVDDITSYIISRMIKWRHRWENEAEKHYTARFKWCILNWLYNIAREKEK